MRQVGIFHRDISLENIMVRRCDGGVHGVLNDFDLALDLHSPDASEGRAQITGTRLFMARDLLTPEPLAVHSGRHDMESLFWVVIWFIYRYENGGEYEPGPTESKTFDDWLDTSDLESKKASFLLGEGGGRKPRLVWQPAWATWVRELCDLYADAGKARSRLLRDLKDANPNNTAQREVFEDRINQLVFRDDSTAWKAFIEAITGDSPEDYPLDTKICQNYDEISAVKF